MTPGPRSATAALAAMAAPPLAGCSLLLRPSPVKLEVLYDNAACDARAPALLVLLPGVNMAPEELRREGFVAAVRQHHAAVDVAIAGAHMGYVQDRSVLKRLREDVVGPARAQGYRPIWLAGISLGGYLAMGYALRHPGEIAGIVAIAPYLGRRQMVQTIADAGGVAAWQGAAPRGNAEDLDHELWSWLAAPPVGAPDIHLAYGTGDRFADAHRLLAQVLPADRVSTAPGSHDWAPWKALWSRWLDRGLLPKDCA